MLWRDIVFPEKIPEAGSALTGLFCRSDHVTFVLFEKLNKVRSFKGVYDFFLGYIKLFKIVFFWTSLV